MAENNSQNLKLLPYTHFKNRLITIQLDKNTIESKLLPIEMIYEPKGTMPNFWKIFWLNKIKYKMYKNHQILQGKYNCKKYKIINFSLSE